MLPLLKLSVKHNSCSCTNAPSIVWWLIALAPPRAISIICTAGKGSISSRSALLHLAGNNDLFPTCHRTSSASPANNEPGCEEGHGRDGSAVLRGWKGWLCCKEGHRKEGSAVSRGSTPDVGKTSSRSLLDGIKTCMFLTATVPYSELSAVIDIAKADF